jgi:alpha-L-arabinofuranosidase
VNTVDAPDRVKPERKPAPEMDSGKLTVLLGKASWNVIRLSNIKAD